MAVKKKKGKKKTLSPMAAAGLVRFFEDVDAKVTISPTMILILAASFAIAMTALNLLLR